MPRHAGFAHFVTDELYEQGNYERVHAAFDQMEEFLRDGSPEVRELVALGFLETLHDVAGLLDNAADHLAPGANHVADLVHRNLQGVNARRVGRNLFAFFAKGWDDGCLHTVRGKHEGRDVRRGLLSSDPC